MNLKESKGNMYEFITHTWNPMGGKMSAWMCILLYEISHLY